MDLPPVTAAELLEHEFMEPLGIGTAELAAAIGVPMATLEAILQGQKAIGTDADRRLCEHFGLSPGYWLRAQALARAALETERLLAIPGMRESILEGMAQPLADCSTEPGW